MQAAGVEYPTEDAQTALVAGPFGIRGVYLTSLCQRSRTRLGRKVGRALTQTECERYFGSTVLSVASERLPIGH